MTFDNGDRVTQDGRFVTVCVGGIKATREYPDTWHAKRAVSRLERAPAARVNFFRRIKVQQ